MCNSNALEVPHNIICVPHKSEVFLTFNTHLGMHFLPACICFLSECSALLPQVKNLQLSMQINSKASPGVSGEW